MYIDRIITQELLFIVKNFPVLTIIGPRRVGKTTLVKHLISYIDKKCLYLDLELDEDLNKLSVAQLFLEKMINNKIVS